MSGPGLPREVASRVSERLRVRLGCLAIVFTVAAGCRSAAEPGAATDDERCAAEAPLETDAGPALAPSPTSSEDAAQPREPCGEAKPSDFSVAGEPWVSIVDCDGAAFDMMATEVTRGLWSAHRPAPLDDRGCSKADCPAADINVYSMLEFANHLSQRAGLTACYDLESCTGEPGTYEYKCSALPSLLVPCDGFRLPTEHEWDTAARAGASPVWPCGSEPSCLESSAWLKHTSDSRPHPVAQKAPNPWGLYDMAGNVAETTFTPDAPYFIIGVRGGTFHTPPELARIDHRASHFPDIPSRHLGFRLVKTQSAPAARP